MVSAIALPWFRVHSIVLNDPGRLLSVHLMHTGLVSGWAGVMCFYEVASFDPSDLTFNPMWRQGMYVLPFLARLGCVESWSGWQLASLNTGAGRLWSIEGVATAHIVLAGLLFAASLWHWVYWDLDLFRDRRTSALALDLPKIFGIHLCLASLLCLGFGSFHCATSPGFWVSDAYGLTGGVSVVVPVWTFVGFDAYNPGGIVAHHIAAGLLGFVAGVFHLCCRPSLGIYVLLRVGNIETVLASSLAAVAWAACVAAATMWYGSASNPIECFGPTRFMWDLGLFLQAVETTVQRA